MFWKKAQAAAGMWSPAWVAAAYTVWGPSTTVQRAAVAPSSQPVYSSQYTFSRSTVRTVSVPHPFSSAQRAMLSGALGHSLSGWLIS